MAVSPHRVGWGVAIGWFLVLVFVGQAARYLKWLEENKRPTQHAAPNPRRPKDEPAGYVALTAASVVPLALAPMMMLRPPGEVSVWLGGAAFLWAGLWVVAAMIEIGRAEAHVIDLTDDSHDNDLSGGSDVIDLRDKRRATQPERLPSLL